jgi:hypothetical protein
MKKLILIAALLLWGGVALADDNPIGIPSLSVKQGAIIEWGAKGTGLKNLSTVTILETRANPNWKPLVNALWSGNTIDVGFAYDATSFNTGAILLGREFGTLGDYLPINYPLAKVLKITLYPIGIYAEDIWNSHQVKVCSGVSVLKLSVTF